MRTGTRTLVAASLAPLCACGGGSLETEGPPPAYKGRAGFFSVGPMPIPATLPCDSGVQVSAFRSDVYGAVHGDGGQLPKRRVGANGSRSAFDQRAPPI